MIEIDRREFDVFARSERFLDRRNRDGLRNSILFDVEDRALEGQVIQYDKAFAKGDKIYVLKAGCFDSNRTKRTGFQVQHLASSEVADTSGALEIFYRPDSVAFRLDLAKAKNGALVGRMCESNSHTAMSIGATFEDVRLETIAGRQVNVVYRARLDEISICKEGAAGDQAFAYLVDKTITPKPQLGRKSATLEAHHSLHKIGRKIRGLRQRIAAMADHSPYRASRSVSVDVMNRWQSEETERLQAMARRLLR